MVLYSSSTQNPPHWVVTLLCVSGGDVCYIQAPNMKEAGQIPEPGLSGRRLFLAAKLYFYRLLTAGTPSLPSSDFLLSGGG